MKANKSLNPAISDEAAEQAFAAMIRKGSEEGKLVAEDELLASAVERDLLNSKPAGHAKEVKKALNSLIKKNKDLRALKAQDGSRRFFSSLLITEAYAGILLQKEGDPLRLIAEIVRQNSKIYPRPVPLDLFTQPPFDLGDQEVRDYIKKMTSDKAYRDISLTATSTSREFLYSSLYLEPDHASMLAQWFDVGRADNP